ncbi:MAG: hypothetical protein ACXAC8_03795 [Candidatus Hodarchaeales archaeon]
MSMPDSPKKLEDNVKLTATRVAEFARDNKGTFVALFVFIAWLVIAQIAGYSILSTAVAIIKLIIYPFLLLLAPLLLINADFDSMNIPEVFILLIPLVVLVTVGFLIIISTED